MRQITGSLDALIPVVRQRLLVEVLLRARGPVHRSELARRLGVTPSSLQRPLQALIRSGLLRANPMGREVLVEANPDNPLIPDLRTLLRKTRGLVEVIQAGLRKFKPRITVAFVYGSVAAGTEGVTSDVDLMVIGEASLGDLVPALQSLEATLGREVSAHVLSPPVFRNRLRERSHFLRSVLEGPKLFVLGGADELDALARGGASQAASNESGGDRGIAKGRREKSRGRGE